VKTHLFGHALVRGALVVVVALAVQVAAGLDRRVDALAVVGARVLGAGLVVVARAVGVALGGGGGGGRAEVVVAGEDALVGHALVRGALVVVVALAVQVAAGLDRRVDALAVVGARVLGAGLVVVARAVGVALGGGGGGGRAEVVVAVKTHLFGARILSEVHLSLVVALAGPASQQASIAGQARKYRRNTHWSLVQTFPSCNRNHSCSNPQFRPSYTFRQRSGSLVHASVVALAIALAAALRPAETADVVVHVARVNGAGLVVVALAVQLAAGLDRRVDALAVVRARVAWCRPCSRCTGGRRRTRWLVVVVVGQR
jgi:hypothetical protein